MESIKTILEQLDSGSEPLWTHTNSKVPDFYS
jgi:hypothetical protein